MNDEQAKRIVRDTLGKPFDEANFVGLVKDILNHVQDAPFDYRGNLIFDDFEDHIKRFQRVGKYQGPNEEKVDILIVHLKKENSLERARTMQRNFVAKYLKRKSQNGQVKDAALVAFVAPKKEDWRLSLVKVAYRLDEQHKVVEELSPPRRYSFLVGKHEDSHTAQSRLKSALQKEDDPTLDYLEHRFSTEPVTEEFFEKYRELFHRLEELIDEIIANDREVRDEFALKGIDTADFAKKLLGQIVFLYFLQKKGWFGVPRDKKWGEGSKNFLRELFEKDHGNYKNFFNDILEPLFYEALSRKHTDDYYSRFDCRIPFLNGGLFDPINQYNWVDVDINLSNDIFSNGDETGILDIFDRYNFTVNENEPLEKEVAVDPEMLGKVFEKLLPVKDRKSGGTYYTPRDIVHYMCRESLASYLVTETQRDPKAKVSEADIRELIEYGEGVVENESRVARKGKTDTYKPQLPESVCDEENARCIDDKLALIRVCDPAVGSGAFLVGMMNEIVRVRNSLTSYINNGAERPPYHFKRQAIESCLYGVDIDSSATEIAKLRLWLSLVVDEEDRNIIQPLPNLDYRIVQGNSLLSMENFLCDPDKAEQLKELQRSHIQEADPDEKRNLRSQIKALQYEIDSVQDSDFGVEFSFRRHFLEVFDDKDGFDVVIGNPPYVKKEHLETTTIQQLESFFDYEIKNGVKKSVKNWSDDLYVHFIFKGVEIVRRRGVMSYITNDSFIGFDSRKTVRDLLLSYDLLRLIQCPPETFDATIYTAIFSLQKSKPQTIGYETGRFSYPDFKYHKLGTVPYELVDINPKRRLVFASPLLEIYKSLLNFSKIKDNLNVIDTGIHSGNVRERLFFKESNTEAKERLLQGKQIERWGVFWDNPKAKFKYCNINYEPKPQKGIGRGGKPSKLDEYWNFCGDIDNHHQPERLLLRQSDDDLVAAYQNEKNMGRFYTDNTLFTVLPGRKATPLKYAMAILNSKLLNTLYHFLSQEEGKTLAQVKIGLVNELPFAPGDQNSIAEVINTVDKILAITGTDDYLQNSIKKARVREYEKQIDQLVYDIYDLTPDEIKIIEESNNPK